MYLFLFFDNLRFLDMLRETRLTVGEELPIPTVDHPVQRQLTDKRRAAAYFHDNSCVRSALNNVPVIDPLRIATIYVVIKQTIEHNINIPTMHSQFVTHIPIHFKIARFAAVTLVTALFPVKA